jgi:hypothetical protein
MEIVRHGLSIGLERVGQEFFVTLKAVGKLTHEDYQEMTPVLEAALQRVEEPRIRLLFDGTEMEGWELRAAWDDFKMGLKHGSKFEKIAIYGNRNWQEIAAKVGSWFMSGEVQYFESYTEAVAWLQQ